MTDSNSPATKSRTLRNRALLGTAIALVLGGAIATEGVILTKTPAYADAVRVDGVAPVSFADVVDKVRPAVVSVRVKSPENDVAMSGDDNDGNGGNGGGGNGQGFFDFQGPPNSPMERFFKQFRQQAPKNQPKNDNKGPFAMALGSGFFVSDDGYVVTNNHVVDKGTQMTVITDDGTEYNAKLVGKDEKTDLALLKVDAPKKFTYVKFADTDVRVGDWVVAVGNPFGLGGTVTAGIVSARGREIGAGPYDDFIQIDAAVNRGNSGGPTFNLNGEVIGVNTAIFSPSGGNVGIAFDIPAATAGRIIGDLEQHGTVTRGWLGVQIQDVTRDIADSLSLTDAKGALVSDPQDGSPAQKAGLKSGDAILAVNGKDVKDPRELAMTIADMAPGASVNITYWRDGSKHDVSVTLGKLPTEDKVADATNDTGNTDQTSALDDFGLALGQADKGQTGVAITDVDPNGQAAERGLQPGDVILSVGAANVAAPKDVETQIADAKKEGQKAVLLRVQSGDQTRFVALSFART